MESTSNVFLGLVLYSILCPTVGFLNNSVMWTSDNLLQLISNTEAWLSRTGIPVKKKINLGNGRKLIGTSFHYDKNYVLMSDSKLNSIFLYQEPDKSFYVHVGVSSSVGQVAVDWLSSNVYWADSSFGWIALQALPKSLASTTFNSDMKVVVEKALDKPFGVAVAPLERYLFWSDFGSSPKLERSSLLGEHRQVIVWQGLVHPHYLSIDADDKRLYWSDANKFTIESCDFNGQERKVVFMNQNYIFHGISVFRNMILYVEAVSKRINIISKNGVPFTQSVVSSGEPADITVFSKQLQPDGTSKCNAHGCESICIEDEQAKCLCQTGYKLDIDNKTCIADSGLTWRSILFSDGSKICEIPVTMIYASSFHVFKERCFIPGTKIQIFVIHVSTATVYFTNSTHIFSIPVFTDSVEIIYASSSSIDGLVLDWSSETLYWSSVSDGILYRMDLTSKSTRQLLNNLGRPTAITLDSIKGRIFWISDTLRPSIQMAEIAKGQSSIKTLVGGTLLKPTKLIYDIKTDRIYWIDTGKIVSMKSGGGSRTSVSLQSGSFKYNGIAVFRDYLLWTRHSQSKVELFVKDMETNLQTSFELKKVDNLIDVQIYDFGGTSVGDIGQCEQNNGGCQQICLSAVPSRGCGCKFGYSLNSDGKSCTSTLVVNNFFFMVDDQQHQILQLSETTRNVQALPVADTNRPSLIICIFNSPHNAIWFDQSQNLIKSSSLTGSDERYLVDTDLTWYYYIIMTYLQDRESLNMFIISKNTADVEGMSLTGLDVDRSSGLIYYILIGGNGSRIMLSSQDRLEKTVHQAAGTSSSLVLSPKTGEMFWVAGENIIQMADMAAKEVVNLVRTNNGMITSLAIDADENVLFWTDTRDGTIKSINILTRSQKTVVMDESVPESLVVKGEFVYFLFKKKRGINRIRKTGSSGVESFSDDPELGKLKYLYACQDDNNLVNHQCSNTNGQCSTFCIPAPTSGRTCSCPDGISIQADQRTCTGVEKCSAEVPNGRFNAECTFYTKSRCTYSCFDGYSQSVSPNVVTCQTDGLWSSNLDTLCTVLTQDSGLSTAHTIGISVGVVLVIVIVVLLLVFVYKRRTRSATKKPSLKLPVFTVSKPDEEHYDAIDEAKGGGDTDRYHSFSKISPRFGRRQLPNNDYLPLIFDDYLPSSQTGTITSMNPETQRASYRAHPSPQSEAYVLNADLMQLTGSQFPRQQPKKTGYKCNLSSSPDFQSTIDDYLYARHINGRMPITVSQTTDNKSRPSPPRSVPNPRSRSPIPDYGL